jgi:hypothetical protein
MAAQVGGLGGMDGGGGTATAAAVARRRRRRWHGDGGGGGGDIRITWDPSTGSVHDWIKAVRPSSVSQHYSWIQVHNVERDSPGFGQKAGAFDEAAYMGALN